MKLRHTQAKKANQKCFVRKPNRNRAQSNLRKSARINTGAQNNRPSSSKYAGYAGVFVIRKNKYFRQKNEPVRSLSINETLTKN